MPIRNDSVVCLNHADIPMQRIDGFNAITAIGVDEQQVQFKPDTGVPVQLYYCRVCGYVESYLAPKTKLWDSIAASTVGFEAAAQRAIANNLEKLYLASATGNVVMKLGEESVEVDAVGETKDGAKVLFEIKSSTSVRALEVAANQLERALMLFSKYKAPQERAFGAIVVPHSSNLEAPYSGYAVVKVNADTGEIQFFGHAPEQPSTGVFHRE